MTAEKFKLGTLTEDDLDQDYMPGRSEKTMSGDHRGRLAALTERVRRAARGFKKANKDDDQIVIVLERDRE